MAVEIGDVAPDFELPDQHGTPVKLSSFRGSNGGVAKAYGVFDEDRGLAIRGTFVIDKEGVVRWKVVNPIPQARDIADYQKALAELA